MTSPVDSFDDGRLAPGSFVGEYRIESLIGEGGMGSVYRAVQPVIGKKVAIKVLAGVLSRDQNAIKRFALEARAVNEIGHKNLVDIFSFGQLPDGRHYYVMEYLDGQSLGEVLRQKGRLLTPEAFPLFRDVGRALAAAHTKGIIHRDLKPDNLILVPESEANSFRAKLLDFGVAKLLEQNVPGAPKTQAGATLGTPQYMAPEQCAGGKIDARTDIYALGIVFFQTLTGRVPFEGESVIEIWQGHVSKQPPRLSDLIPESEVSDELEALLAQMLAKDPKHRLQSAAQFCEALDAVAPTLGMQAARKGREPRLDAPLKRGKPLREAAMNPQPPVQGSSLSFPGARTDTKTFRIMAESLSNITDVVSLDEAMLDGSSPPPPPVAAPAPVRKASQPPQSFAAPVPGPATSQPMAMAPDPYMQESLREIEIGRPSISAAAHRYRPPQGYAQSRTPSPAAASSGGFWPIVFTLLFLAAAGAGGYLYLQKRAATEPTPTEEPAN